MGGFSMSGKGTNTSNQQSSSPYAPLLAKFGQAALPVFQQLASQLGEATRTGGVNAGIPLINSSVDAARESASTAQTGTAESLARAGLGDSSFAQRILSEQSATQGQAIAAIPGQVAGQFIGMAPGLTGQGIGAASTAAGVDRNINSQQLPSWLQYFVDALGSGGGQSLGGAAASFS